MTDDHTSETEPVSFSLGNLRGELSGQFSCSSDHLPILRVMQMQLQTHHSHHLHLVAEQGEYASQCVGQLLLHPSL